MSDEKIIDVCSTKRQVCILAENMPPLIVWVENGKYKTCIAKYTPNENIEIIEQSNKTSIEDLVITLIAENALKNSKIFYIEDLMKISTYELQKLPHVGKKTLKEALEQLERWKKESGQFN